MTTTTCKFLKPFYWNNSEKELQPLEEDSAQPNPIWNYSEIICDDEVLTLIKNETTDGEFYVQKTLTYGEAMILWFLTIFAFYLIFKTTYNFFWGK